MKIKLGFLNQREVLIYGESWDEVSLDLSRTVLCNNFICLRQHLALLQMVAPTKRASRSRLLL